MRHPRSSLGIALLLASVLVASADPSLAAIEPSTAQAPSSPAVNSRNSAVFLPAAPAQVAPVPAAGAAKQGASEPPARPGAGVAAGAPVGQPADPAGVEVTKLKHQIKTTRLSLADTQGRLAVTEKDLSSAATENTQLRSDSTNLRVGLAKAETVAKKSEDELGHRRQEVQALQTARRSGAGTIVVILLLCLVITGMLAVVLLGHGSKLRAILDRMHDAKADERRVDELKAELEEARQRAQRFEEESQRLRAAAENPAPAPAGSKREKVEQLRRELRDVQAAVEAEKRRADERVRELEAEMARTKADKQAVDERIQRLEPEMTELAAAKQVLFEHVQKLEPEVARLSSDKEEAEQRSRLLAHDAARLTAEKLRLEHALAKANEKLTFFGHEEPEDTLPPIVG